jgi:hypothetical protein
MNTFYKIFGVKLTNMLVNKTAGDVFTSGETISTLVEDIKSLASKNIGGVANYVAEGLHEMNQEIIL